jgi:hypothetical protein
VVSRGGAQMLRGECFHVVRPKFVLVLRPQATKLPYLSFGSHIIKSDNMKETLLLELGLSYVSLTHVNLATEWRFSTFTETVNFTNISVFTLRSITILST